MDYYQYHIIAGEEQREVLSALLSELPFEMFEDAPDGFCAYLPAAEHTDAVGQQLEEIRETLPFDYEATFIPYQNWNAVWESNFEPVVVDSFCAIRANFHPHFPECRHEITIQPKMAFGTGHHETTHLVIEAMEHLDLQGKKVLDYGCGTGILAILASKLGAAEVDAVDNEYPAYENTLENSAVNGVANIRTAYGTLDAITGGGYDVILANITRNVIIASLPALHEKIWEGGQLVISGFVLDDRTLMAEALGNHGFELQQSSTRNNWVCMTARKS